MDFLFDGQAIIACSTNLSSPSAVALLRISGFKNLLDLQPFFSFDLKKTKPRYAHLSSILCDNKKMDEALITFFPAPHSYTGENVLEMAVHGNPISVNLILEHFISSGLMRSAKEGEFTYRALQNKKMSLSQVEGLDLLLNAQSGQAFSQGLSLLHGELHEEYLKLHEIFLKLKASVELSIDFLEDVGEEQADHLLQTHLKEFETHVNSLQARSQGNNSQLLTPSIVLVGQTNAGKSSLFNGLLKSKRSIVSPQAGTTRDFVSEYTYKNGVNFRLVDTAGLRLTQDPIEQEGIERALQLFGQAFFRILVVNPFETELHHFEPLFTHFKKDELDLVVITHSDCPEFESEWTKYKDYLPATVPQLFLTFGPMGPARGSIEPLKGHGPMGPAGSIEPVLDAVYNKFVELYSTNPVLISRHRDSINKIYHGLQEFKTTHNSIKDIAIISSKINLVGKDLEELIGLVSSHEVLDSIFSRFCIGK